MLLIGPALLKNTSSVVETGDCAVEPVELRMFSNVGLAMFPGPTPAMPELSSSICTSEAVKAVFEPILWTVCAANSKFVVFKLGRDARKPELESSFIPAIDGDVPLPSNAVPSARPIIESTEFDVVTALPINDFVLPTKWSITARRSVPSNPDISRPKVEEFALVSPFSSTECGDGEESTRLGTTASCEVLDVSAINYTTFGEKKHLQECVLFTVNFNMSMQGCGLEKLHGSQRILAMRSWVTKT